jgi:exopolysaccharide biosynthesis predicted pyruvyltransferase EpsI
MGISSLEPQQKKMFEEMLSRFKNISVREQSAKDILQPLTSKKIDVVLDPTLLLERSQYELIEQKPKDLKEGQKYILCYILGGKEQQSVINEYAMKHGLQVILFSDKRDSNYGVEEFLYLINHAELICTDSFHACVFSLIFERPFVAFKRTGVSNYMYTRLQNLIDIFALKNREFNGMEITEDNLKVDYSEAKKILKKKQEESLDFIKKALEIENEN